MKSALLVALLALTFCESSQGDEPKLRATLIGHRSAVNAVAFAPYRSVLASASDDKTVKLWNLTTGKNVTTFIHPSPVLSVAFDDLGFRLIAGCKDGTVMIWNLFTERNTATIHADLPARQVWLSDSIWDVCFGGGEVGVTYPTKNKPVDGSDLWDLFTGKKIPVAITCNSLNLDVSAASEKGWAIANEEPHYPDHPISDGEISFTPTPKDGSAHDPIALRGHGGRVTSLAFNPRNANCLVSGSLDKTIKFWNPATARCTGTLTEHTGGVLCVEFSRDGKMLVSGSADATIKIWDVPQRMRR